MHCTETMIGMTVEFSSEVTEARKHGATFLKCLNKNNNKTNKTHPKTLSPPKISFKNGNKIKAFSDKTM